MSETAITQQPATAAALRRAGKKERVGPSGGAAVVSSARECEPLALFSAVGSERDEALARAHRAGWGMGGGGRGESAHRVHGGEKSAARAIQRVVTFLLGVGASLKEVGGGGATASSIFI